MHNPPVGQASGLRRASGPARIFTILTLTLAAACPSLFAQTRVYVTAPSVRITASDTSQLSAIARNSSGDPIPSATFQWSTSNAAVAQIDSSGNLTAGVPGLADITAVYLGNPGVLRVQVLPQRIDVTPGNMTIEFGSQQQFTAVAYDIKGKPIPNVNFVWHLGIYSGGDSTTVSMRNGLVTATTLGYFIVRAAVAYPYSPEQFQLEFDGQTPLRIIPPAAYKLSRLTSNDYARPQFAFRGRRTSMAAAEDGTLYLSGILDGLANGLLQYGANTKLTPFLLAGNPSFFPGVVTWDFEDPSVDSGGNVVARMANISSGNMIVEATTEGDFNMLVGDGVSTDRGQFLGGLYSNRYSLSDTGDVFFRASATDPNANNYRLGMFRYSGGRVYQEAALTDQLPGFPGPIASFDTNFGIDSSGAVTFIARGSTAIVYRKESGGDPIRLVGIGDIISGYTITNFNQYGLARNGDVYLACPTKSSNVVLVFPKGQKTPRLFVIPSYLSTLMDANSTTGIVFTGDAGSGYGLYTWNPLQGGSPQPVILRGRPLPTGEPYYESYWATLDASGRVFAAVQGVNSPWLLLLAQKSTATIVAAPGDSIAANANLNLSPNLVPGDKSTGAFHMFAGGNQSSVFEVNKQSLKPLAVVNDKLPGGGLFSGTNPVKKSPSGDMYVATDQVLYRLESSGPKTLTSFPFLKDGVNNYSAFVMSVNDQKQIAFGSYTGAGDQRLHVLNPGGDIQTLAYFNGSGANVTPLPGGGSFGGLNDVAINESGAVLVSVTASGAQGGLFLWDGTSWKTSCQLQSCTLDGQIVTSVSQVKASGNRFCAFFNTRLNISSIRCLDNGVWSAVITRGESSSDGTEVNSIGPFDVNRKGEVAAVIYTSGLGGPSLFLKNANGYTTINAALFPLLDGTTFRVIFSVDLRDDGRVFFIGMDFNDKMVVYEADPHS